ncbi:MAG TPA: contractile injection system tape measure protein, partial [Cellvibrio sp.]
MQPEHRIDELIVDLSFTSTRLARHEQALLSDWLSEDLLPALDGLFSRYSPGQQVLRFETLEFDFGNLTNRNYQQSIREQLLQKFAQLLQTQLLAVMTADVRLPEQTNSGDNPNARIALAQLFNYLASGQLAAHQPFEQPTRTKGRELTSATSVNPASANSDIAKDSDTSNNADKKYAANNPVIDSQHVKKVSKPIVKQNALHEQLLDAVIAQHNIAELLRELPQRDVLVQRLLTQFSAPQRLELLRQLAPQQVHNAITLLDLLQLVENNSINAEAQHLDSNVVWRALLQLGLEYPQANLEFWLRHIFRTVSAHAAIDSRLLQYYLTAIKIPFSSAATPLINMQTQIAQLSADENLSTSEPYFAVSNAGALAGQAAAQHANLDQFDSPAFNPAQPDTTQLNPEQSNSEQLNSEQGNAEQFNTGQLRQLIAAAFIRADASQLQQLWPQLIANEQQLLVAALTHYLPQAEIRQQLMLRLPLVLQAEIIALLAPAFKKHFFQLHQNAGQLIKLLAAQTTLLRDAEGVAAPGNAVESSAQSPELLLRQLWEIALGLIFNKQSAVSNTDYVADSNLLLMNLAARYADLHNLDHIIVQQAFDSLFNQPQTHQQSLINTVNLPKQSGELHGNATVSHEHQTIKPEADLLFDSAARVSAESGDTSQKNIGLEKNDQTSKNLAVKNQEANSDQADSQGADNYEDIESGINGLSRVSDHQLFDLCLRLKSGALAWGSLANDVALLQRLISSYIRLGHSATAENCTDFVAAIAAQAESSDAPSAFYLAVLQTLIADKLIDLEAIAQGIQRSDRSTSLVSKLKSETREEMEMKADSAVQASALRNAEVSAANAGPVASVAKQLELEALAAQLRQGNIKPESLNLTVDQITRLVDIFITTEKTIAPDIQADLIAAIHQQALRANRKADYYQRILSLLVRKEMLDLMQVCEQVNQQAIAQPITPAVTVSNNIETIARTLLAESAPERRLQALQLDLAQWQEVVAELIQKLQSIGTDSRAELIEAIQRQAGQVTHPAHYYRLVIAAVLAREAIDLETLKATANQQPDAFTNPQKVLQADTSLPLGKVQGAGEYEAEGAGYKSAITEPDPHQSIGQEIVPQFTSPPMASAGNITSIVQTLLAESAPERWLQALQLDLAQWQEVVAELIQQVQFVDKDSGTELIDAVQRQSRQVVHSAQYYRLVIAAVLAGEPIDLEAFSRAANSSTELMPAQLPAKPQNIFQRISSPITSTTSTRVIAQTLLTDPQSWAHLQQLQLGDKQWETLSTELIRQAQFIDQHAGAELIEAIQTHARLAITPVAYYRLVIQAVLQQEPIDLEAFAATSDNSINQQDHRVDTGEFAVKKSNSGKSSTQVLDADPIDTVPVLPANISQNSIDSQQVNPDQAMDYPLLTGSDNSLHKPALSLAQLLAAELPLNQEQLLALQQHINTLLNRSNPAMITEWCELLAVAQYAQVLIHSVPAHLLHQIAMRLQASRYPWLDAVVKLVMEALALLVADINNLPIKQAKWKFIFNYLFSVNNTATNVVNNNAVN